MPDLINRAVGAAAGTPKSLFARNSGIDYYVTFELPVGTDYSVPAGKVFKITRVVFAGAAGNKFAIGYGDTGVSTGVSAPTAPVFIIGSGADFGAGNLLVPAAANTLYSIDIYGEIPAGKFPMMRSEAVGTNCQLIGVEETA